MKRSKKTKFNNNRLLVTLSALVLSLAAVCWFVLSQSFNKPTEKPTENTSSVIAVSSDAESEATATVIDPDSTPPVISEVKSPVKSESSKTTSSKATSSKATSSKATSSKTTSSKTVVSKQPYLVKVNRAMCTVTVYGKDSGGNYTVPVKAMACSVGRAGHETPKGTFKTSDRYEWRRMVDKSYGRYAIRINGSIMFHSVCYYTKSESDLEYEEFNKLGSPASLGCIRLCLKDIKWLYDNCPKGFTTVIYDDTSSAGPLGKPETVKIDINDQEKRCYDPTDTSQNSPWNR